MSPVWNEIARITAEVILHHHHNCVRWPTRIRSMRLKPVLSIRAVQPKPYNKRSSGSDIVNWIGNRWPIWKAAAEICCDIIIRKRVFWSIDGCRKADQRVFGAANGWWYTGGGILGVVAVFSCCLLCFGGWRWFSWSGGSSGRSGRVNKVRLWVALQQRTDHVTRRWHNQAPRS